MSRFSSSNHRASKVPLANGSRSGIGRPNRSTGSAPDTHRSTSRVSAARRVVSGLSDRGLLNATARLVKTERLTTLEMQLLIQFVAGEAFMGKYHEARSLLSNKLTEISFATVFEATLDAFLDKHSPARKQARRETRVAVKKRATQKDQTKRTPEPKTQQRKPAARADQLSRKKFDGRCRSGTDVMLTGTRDEQAKGHKRGSTRKTSAPAQKKTPGKSRHISAKTRDAVFIRDKNRCTHVGTNGKRCESTYRLHIDHIIPYARGGTNALSNLRLLCAKHNKFEAKRVYGATKIDAHCRRE